VKIQLPAVKPDALWLTVGDMDSNEGSRIRFPHVGITVGVGVELLVLLVDVDEKEDDELVLEDAAAESVELVLDGAAVESVLVLEDAAAESVEIALDGELDDSVGAAELVAGGVYSKQVQAELTCDGES
jgi:hypothetical protein